LQINGKPRLLKENFVLARCSTSRLSRAGWTWEERQVIAEMRWWTLDELSTSSKDIKPPRLASLLRNLLTAITSGSHDSAVVHTIDLQ
jgi:hypothetical protein